MSCRCISSCSLAIVGVLFSTASFSTAIDLNDFYADPTVVVSPDGSSAVFSEDPGFSEVSLSNDPGLGDPEVVVAAPGLGLYFDYAFAEAPGEDNSLFQFVVDGANGGSMGPAYEFFVDSSASGTVVYDLTPLVGQQLGLTFSLQSGLADTGFDSTLTISNVRLDPLPVVSGPAPLWVLLWGVGWLALGKARRGD